MGAIVLDASVVIGFLNPRDALHDRAVELLAPCLGRGDELFMPSTGYAEILVHAYQEGRPEHIEHFVEDAEVRIIPIDRDLGRQSAELRARVPSLRLPDALVLATALRRDTPLLTLDVRLERLFEKLRAGTG